MIAPVSCCDLDFPNDPSQTNLDGGAASTTGTFLVERGNRISSRKRSAVPPYSNPFDVDFIHGTTTTAPSLTGFIQASIKLHGSLNYSAGQNSFLVRMLHKIQDNDKTCVIIEDSIVQPLTSQGGGNPVHNPLETRLIRLPRITHWFNGILQSDISV